MIDHVGIPVTDLAASRELYAVALAPLGYKVLYESDKHGIVGFGAQQPQLWLHHAVGGAAVHVAVTARARAAVGSFYGAALSAGAKDNGPPGPREHYAPGYYAAYVHDLDGNNLEAVVHEE